MKKLFPGHYTPSEEEFRQIWQEGIIIFDTNVLLDLYRYSDDTVISLLDIMDRLKERIWIPFQVAKEYHKNLNSVISDQVKKYDQSINTLKEFRKQIDEKRNHPFLDNVLTKEIQIFCAKFDSELSQKQDVVKKLITQNPIKEKLSELLDSKIGSEFNYEELDRIYLEGEKRYKSKIPPGYEDASKPSPERYGDLIFWKEILKKNNEINKPILLITGDKKKDWFNQELGLTIGPRPELIEELKKQKDNLFYIYPADVFLAHSEKYLKIPVDIKIIKEVEEFITDNSQVSQIDLFEFERPFFDPSLHFDSGVTVTILDSDFNIEDIPREYESDFEDNTINESEVKFEEEDSNSSNPLD